MGFEKARGSSTSVVPDRQPSNPAITGRSDFPEELRVTHDTNKISSSAAIIAKVSRYGVLHVLRTIQRAFLAF